jgi:hypothetical protein
MSSPEVFDMSLRDLSTAELATLDVPKLIEKEKAAIRIQALVRGIQVRHRAHFKIPGKCHE